MVPPQWYANVGHRNLPLQTCWRQATLAPTRSCWRLLAAAAAAQRRRRATLGATLLPLLALDNARVQRAARCALAPLAAGALPAARLALTPLPPFRPALLRTLRALSLRCHYACLRAFACY